MVVCPACGYANSPKSRFCTGCGARFEVAQAVPTESVVVPHAEAGAASSEFDVTLPVGEESHASSELRTQEPAVAFPPALPPVARIEPELPAEPEVKIEPPVEPRVRGLEVEEEKEEEFLTENSLNELVAECPVAMALNFNRVFVAENSSTFEIRVENTGALPLQNVEILFESPRALDRPLHLGFKRLAAAQRLHRLVEVEPKRVGNFVLQCSVTLEIQGERASYVATRSLRVNAAPDASNIVINISDIQSNRDGQANSALGAEYGDINISNLVDGKTIRTLNELIELELPEKFEPLNLDLDYQLSMKPDLVEVQERLANEVLIPRKFLAVANPGEVLHLEPVASGAGEIVLVARNEFKLGRSRQKVDFVTWFLPRSPQNDEKTRRLSQVHAILEVGGSDLKVRDGDSSNGSSYNGVPLEKEQGVRVDRRGTLALATEYELDVLYFQSAFESREPAIANIGRWSGPEHNRRLPHGAVRFMPKNQESSAVTSVWLLSDAAFGCSHHNGVIIENQGIAEIQGRFLFYRGCFWLENAAKNDAVGVDSHVMRAGEIVPLATGQQLKLGDVTYRVQIH